MCEVKIFLPFKKKGTIERKTQHVSHFLSNLSLKSFTFRLFEKKRKKNRESKKRWIFSRILHLFVSHYVIIYYVELFSLCAYTIKRGLGKREKTSAYKSNNTNKRERERERKNSFDNTQNR